jgi:hypothetical protein
MPLFLRFLLALMALQPVVGLAQQRYVQTVRGTVRDQDSQVPLIGATVVVLGSDPILGAGTDVDGRFSITGVPVGRQTLLVRYLGYAERVIPEVLVSTGKEVVLDIDLLESTTKLDEVVVKADKGEGGSSPINEMAVVSTRSFSMEQSTRFAASINDPGRLALSFAGVNSTNDITNEIVIRGNSPKGLLWRLEGVEIPTPNHFTLEGMSAGNISILSNNLLDASDFSTGAFPAEYGNALSGVYDLRLRSGNDQKREFTVQAGFLGVEASAEGPFIKGKRSSFLINYRYSTLALFKLGGANLQGDLITDFQDVNMKFNFPTKRFGTFSLFGVAGFSNAYIKAEEDSTKWSNTQIWDDDRVRQTYTNHYGVGGLSHRYIINEKNYVHTTLAFSSYGNYTLHSYLGDSLEYYDYWRFNVTNMAVRFATQFNTKVNAKHHLRYGVNYSHLMYDLEDRELYPKGQVYLASGDSPYWQAFLQHKFRISEKLTLISGLHFNHFVLNDRVSVEPRLAVSWQVRPRHTLSLGAGLHSRLESLAFYLAQKENSDRALNRNLDFSRAVHVVAGHSWTILPRLSLRSEVYFQYLYSIPVRTTISSYSALNHTFSYQKRALANSGDGINYGLELTLEKSFGGNWYMLYTLSLYDSRYRASDGVWRNTVYNGNYVTSLTGGKDFRVGKGKKDIIGVNAKVFFAGSKRITPIDLEASKVQGEEVRDELQINEGRTDDYFRLDMKVSYRHNFKRLAFEIAVDVQNLTNRKNELSRKYDIDTESIKKKYQQGIIPVMRLRVEF